MAASSTTAKSFLWQPEDRQYSSGGTGLGAAASMGSLYEHDMHMPSAETEPAEVHGD